jgi:hypothetical protein
MKNFKLLLATAALAVSGSALAGPSYTYADFGYLQADEGYIDAIAVSGSYAVTDQVHLLGSYIDGDDDGDSFDGYSVGVGYNMAMTDGMDLVARISYTEYDFDFGDEDFTAFEIGPRAMVTDNLELNGAITYTDYENDDEVTGIRVGGQLYFDNISVGAQAEVDDSDTEIGFNVRYTWR